MGSRAPAPIAILDQSIDTHPATQAWVRLGLSHGPLEIVEIWRETATHQPASVYRLVFRNAAIPAVFAKHCAPREAAVERLCLETILPRIRISSPEYYGSIEDSDGSCWLFLEDVGRQMMVRADPEHRLLAARWLGRLHRQAAHVTAATRLPPAGLHRYWTHLRSGHERIHRNLDNPGLTAEERDLLKAVLVIQGQVAARWDQIERACADFPATLVHGDFQPKNVRIRSGAVGPVLYVLDWEMAGWGIPAVDVSAVCGISSSGKAEADAYVSEVQAEWPHMDADTISRLAAMGSILRRVTGFDWESTCLHFEHPNFLSRPIASIRGLYAYLTVELEAGARWLA